MKKKIVITVLIILAAVVVFVWWRKKRKKAATAEVAAAATNDLPQVKETSTKLSTASADMDTTPELFPLKNGSRGDEVRKFQSAFNYLYGGGEAVLSEDGVFGNKTESELKEKFNKKEVSESLYRVLTTMYKNGANMGIASTDLMAFYTYYKDNPDVIKGGLYMLYKNTLPKSLVKKVIAYSKK